MNTNKVSLITAGLMAVGLVSSASAQVVVHITGSSAYRANINNILSGAVNNGGANYVFDEATVTPTGTAFSTSASQLVFHGHIGGTANPVDIDTGFTGSEAGIAAISSTAGTRISNPIPSDTADDGVTSIANTPNSGAALPGTPLASYLNDSTGTGTLITGVSDIAMADTSINVSLTKSANVTDANAGAPVGIVQFKWMKGFNSSPDSSWNDVTGVTLPQVNVLLGGGEQFASFLTGNSADTDAVVIVGRNKGSGTRVNMLADQNYGITKNVNQYGVGNFTYNASGVLTAPTGTTISGSSQVAAIGNDGYDSGSGVKASLNLDGNGSKYVVIGYIGLADAAGVTHQNNLTLNGVAYSDAAIESGQYTYYGHEHMYVSAAASATAQAVASKLVTALKASEVGGISGIPTTSMKADRSGDTGYPAPSSLPTH